MNTIDLDYKMVVEQIMRGGELTETRNGKVMRSFYPFVLRCDKAPLVGWRKINHHLGIREMEWFLNGDSTLGSIPDSIYPWWNRFADNQGSLGPYHYGKYLAYIEQAITDLVHQPFSRRHVLSCWDKEDMNEQEFRKNLTNCHSTACQFYVSNNGELHYKTYQRSADVMLGLPYNLIQHWALLEYVAHRTGYKVGTMDYLLGDSHIYDNHFEAARELMASLRPKNELELIYEPSGDSFTASDFSVIGDCEYPIKTKLEMRV